MADTVRADFDNTPCSDCGTTKQGEVTFKHWGQLVPEGTTGHFCFICLEARRTENQAGFTPRPLGTISRAQMAIYDEQHDGSLLLS